MLLYAILAYLCLLARADSEDDILSFPYRILQHETPGTQLDKYLISPDTFRGRETYVVAQYSSLEDYEKHGVSTPLLQIKLALLNDRRGTESKECSMFLKAEPHARDLHLTSVRRINETNVVLSWTYLGANDVAHTSVVNAYNIENEDCRETKLSLNGMLNNPVVVPTIENQFVVLINDPKYCKQTESPSESPKCWLSFNLSNNSRRIYSFKTDLDWSTLRAERLTNRYIKVHGSNIENDHYMIYLLDTQYKKIYHVNNYPPYNNKKLDIVTKGMSICYINPDHKATVYCKQMSNHGEAIFYKEIHFEEPRKLIDVRTTQEGEIFLLTNNADCEGADCWNMYATRISQKSDKVERILLPFQCSGDDQTKLTVFGAKNIAEYKRTDFYYGCKWGDKFNFNTYFLYRSAD